jgi:hypothetical protein
LLKKFIIFIISIFYLFIIDWFQDNFEEIDYFSNCNGIVFNDDETIEFSYIFKEGRSFRIESCRNDKVCYILESKLFIYNF